MMNVFEAAQMQDCDRRASEEYRIAGAVLMENAGLQVLEVLHELNAGQAPLSTAIVCGPGNNGGDGFVVARQLHNLGREAVVYLLGSPDALRGDALLNHGTAAAFGVPIVVLDPLALDDLAAVLSRFEFVVDALLGTGTRGPLRASAAAVVAAVNDAGTRVLAVDLPSGLAADTGAVEGPAVRAMATVALAGLKPCHVLAPALDYCGAITVAEISMPAQLVDALHPVLRVPERADVAAVMPVRGRDTHKGTYGRVLVIGGAPGTAGAVTLAARGALRAGAGLVDVVCPSSVYEAVACAATEALVHAQPADAAGGLAATWAGIAANLEAAAAIVIGPGLGTGADARALVAELLAGARVPLIIDADGLNALETLEAVDDADGPRILTPHPGEAARLLGVATADVQADRPAAARELADRGGAIVILKGHRTLIAAPGQVTVVNPTGNPGMATGGTGDVLAGVVGALLCQGLTPWQAAWSGAWLHGAAGDAAAAAQGEISMIAGDLADALPAAFKALEDCE